MATKFSAGRLRHRVDLERLVSEQDSNGDITETFVLMATNVAAEIAPLSAREALIAKQVESKMSAKITIRDRPGIDHTWRVVHTVRGVVTYYNVEGVIKDPDTGIEWLTLPCSQGVNRGG